MNRANPKPGKHLDFSHPQMKSLRNWCALIMKDQGIHPALVLNFDQVWSVVYNPKAKTIMKSSKPFDELSKKKSLRSIRHVIERMLGMDHSEFFGEKVPAPMDPSVTGGAAASAAIENWRIPRTLCSLSWRDGTLGRAFITCRDETLTNDEREKANEDWAFKRKLG